MNISLLKTTRLGRREVKQPAQVTDVMAGSVLSLLGVCAPSPPRVRCLRASRGSRCAKPGHALGIPFRLPSAPLNSRCGTRGRKPTGSDPRGPLMSCEPPGKGADCPAQSQALVLSLVHLHTHGHAHTSPDTFPLTVYSKSQPRDSVQSPLDTEWTQSVCAHTQPHT